MGRPRENLALLEFKGKKHLSEKEKEERAKTEVKILNIDFKKIKPPKILNKEQKLEFKKYAKRLYDSKIFCDLDSDILGRYIQAKTLYDNYTELLNKKIPEVNYRSEDFLEEISKIQRMQNTAFKQCQTCANSMGLNIKSRGQLVIPKSNEPDEDDEL